MERQQIYQITINQNYQLQMQSSFSEDVLQKMRMQLKKSQFLRNPQGMLNNSTIMQTHYFRSTQSPQQVTYNEIIHDGQSKIKGRYKLRNCRQPNLKVIKRKSVSREKGNSLLGLKQLMKEQMERYSIKKKYEHILQNYSDNEIAQNLKLDLVFLPSSAKVPHKNRYRPNRPQPQPKGIIHINGNKIIDNSKTQQTKQNQTHIDQFPDIAKKTNGFQLKYKRHYLTKKFDEANKKRMHQPVTQKQKQEEFPPLTGWF